MPSSAAPGALQLRQLQTMSEIATENNSTIVFPIPVEILEAFQAVGGFDPDIIAAEDDELCLRIRTQGWSIVRLDSDMATHDMAMTRFRQWWRRSVRTGHAYAEGAARRGFFLRSRNTG